MKVITVAIERPKIDPRAVKFEEIECCAVRSAITCGLHEKWIKNFILEIQLKDEPKYNTSVLTEIFTNTIRLVFIPTATHRQFYFQLATMERKRLEELEGIALHECNHGVAAHIKALNNIRALMICLPAATN